MYWYGRRGICYVTTSSIEVRGRCIVTELLIPFWERSYERITQYFVYFFPEIVRVWVKEDLKAQMK